MVTRIIHLSDLHIGRNMPGALNNESDNLSKIVDWLVSTYEHESNKPMILITGDIINDGTEAEFQ